MEIVGVAEMKVSGEPGAVLATEALGSCVGVAVYDPVAEVGGILHAMLPSSSVYTDQEEQNPFMFLDLGTPLFFRALYAAGAIKERLAVKIAGGASIGNDGEGFFSIGKRNVVMLQKLFWKNGIPVAAHHVGGHRACNLHLEIGTGRTWVTSNGREYDL